MGTERRKADADHPRIRGEHVDPLLLVRIPSGSSPHTRGARPGRSRPLDHGGIIPAYAGSTRDHLRGLHSQTDHPRIRGEHVIKIGADLSAQGSSPHTRGAPRRGTWRRISNRIIPAYAGSTRQRSRIPDPLPDHPRRRGEHSGASRLGRPVRGSSPHTRGARTSSYPASGNAADHPRIRGEHASAWSKTA